MNIYVCKGGPDWWQDSLCSTAVLRVLYSCILNRKLKARNEDTKWTTRVWDLHYL